MRKLKINRTDFETAFELSSYEIMAYLDTKTSAVIFVEDYVVDQLEELLADTCHVGGNLVQGKPLSLAEAD